MSDPGSKWSKAERRGVWSAALLFIAVPVVAAVLFASDEPERKPSAVAVTASPPPPEPERERPKKRAERKPKPKPKPKPQNDCRNVSSRVDRKAPSPVAVTVPSAGISAPTIPLGLQPDRTMEVPKDISVAGWREGGPEPGERGAAMITAHVNGGGQPGAFANLGAVSQGDEICVRRRDGTTVAFKAERTERVPKDGFPTQRVYGKTPGPTLRLVTCDGDFDSASGHYRDNLIVYAKQVRS